MDRLLAAAEDHGVAALDAERGGVDRHVRPRLVDEEDHARAARGPSAPPARWAGRSTAITSPTGSGRAATCSKAPAIPLILGGEPQPVDLGIGQAELRRGGQVELVGGQQIGRPFHQPSMLARNQAFFTSPRPREPTRATRCANARPRRRSIVANR